MYLQILSCCEPLISPFGSLYSPFTTPYVAIVHFACNMQKERTSSFSSIESETKFSHSLALFFINIGILILSFKTLHYYFLSLPLYTLEFLSYPSKGLNSALFLCTLEFWPHPFRHWNSYLILPPRTLEFCPIFINIGILIYPSKHCKSGTFLYTLVFLSDLSKHWNSGRISISVGIMILLIQILEFWPCFYKRWNSHLILPNTGNLALFLMHIGFLILSFLTVEFWPYIFINIEILIFSLH